MGESEETIPRGEFIERFVKYMVSSAGAMFADGSSIEEYARETAPSYWADKSQREGGPEECAQGDMDCWEAA